MRAIASLRKASARAAMCVAFAGLGACTSWRPVAKYDGWSLYAESDQDVEAARYESAVSSAKTTVEALLGPFERSVRVHVWNGSDGPATAGAEVIHAGEGGPVQDVPGIGPARVRAFHARSQGLFGQPAGIFLAAPEPGTAAHELVHARAAEQDLDLPLWLEEGVACVLGDGFQDRGRWIVDGLSCWPVHELQSQPLDDPTLARVLELRASDRSTALENVLAHFVGWAIVFDLYVAEDGIDWRGWCERYGNGISLGEARMRLERTIDPATAFGWMERLRDPRREVRLATAKGVWKLRSAPVASSLLDALEKEEDAEVKVGFAINLLACAGEARVPDVVTGRFWRAVWPALKHAELADPDETQAVQDLLKTFRSRGGRKLAGEPLGALRRFWAE